MTDFLGIPVDDDTRELLPQQGGNGGTGLPMPMETKIGDVVQMRKAAVLLPRKPAKIRMEIAEMAELFGDEWEYRFPVKNKRTGETDFIEGPTIGCTMSIARAYGNCDVAHTRTEDDKGGNAWVLYSTFLDLQSGFSLTRGFRQRKGQSTMGSDRARGEDIDFQIGVSKSTRNVVARALDDYVRYARQCARERLTKSVARRADEYRERIEGYLTEINYPITAIEGALGAPIARWTNEQIASVVRTLAAHKDRILGNLDEVYRPQPEGVEGTPQERPVAEKAKAADAATTRQAEQTKAEASEASSDERSASAAYQARVVDPWRKAAVESAAREQAHAGDGGGSGRRTNQQIVSDAISKAETVKDLEDALASKAAAKLQQNHQQIWAGLLRDAEGKKAEIERRDAERAASIPAQDQGYSSPPEGYDPETGEVDPQPEDKVWYVLDDQGEPIGTKQYSGPEWLDAFEDVVEQAKTPLDKATLRRRNGGILAVIADDFPDLALRCAELAG